MSRRKDNPSRWRVWPKERKTKRAAVKPDAEALELVQGLPQPGNHGLLRRVQKGLFGDREAG